MSSPLQDLQSRIATEAYRDEADSVRELFAAVDLSTRQRARIRQQAEALIVRSRRRKQQRDKLDAFLEEFGLNTQEGVVLMCLAEALLRVPDDKTADSLINEKLLQGNWQEHLGQSKSLFVNASAWGLLLSGRWLRFENSRRNTRRWLDYLFERFSEPTLRRIMLQAMRIMGDQYILGRSISEALERLPREYPGDTLFSFDALGEGARNAADARRHFEDYAGVIRELGDYEHGLAPGQSHGVSIKLSALHPRYQWTQRERVHRELLPQVRELALAARKAEVALSIDAEEAERLDIGLEVFAALASDPELSDWSGLGFVLQAYQKRALAVSRWLTQLAEQREAPFSVRLVKGAYWDREIKRSQQLGLSDYPVFTRKANTDLSYFACAAQLLDAGSERIWPQFATHNAATLASLFELAGDRPFELQRLHGMGELLYTQLYDAAQRDGRKLPALRVYAPVGGHKDLLPYLVRRLLENGANSSFVNRFLDENESPERLSIDPLTAVEKAEHLRNSRIPAPPQLFSFRANSSGLDLENPSHCAAVVDAVGDAAFAVADEEATAALEVRNPAQTDSVIGHYRESDRAAIDTALSTAQAAWESWDQLGGRRRADCLEAFADHFEKHKLRLLGLICREAGRTLKDAEAEVREAIDFCHYYAFQARRHFAEPQMLEGPTGEDNIYSLHGRGVFACISPWNFPMAIFVGQISAALAAGNAVIAKPAEQTTLIARELVALMQEAGLPAGILQLLQGEGATVGPQILADRRVAGVAFTGSTATARRIQQSLIERGGPLVPLIAETGGINTMLVDSTALTEQVVDDVLESAFHSAGQRCSALRLLCLQEDTADEVLAMLCGACDELQLGDPARPETDVGPIIDAQARQQLQSYVEESEARYKLLYRYPEAKLPRGGHFFGPHIFEVGQFADVEEEVFGPVLHVLRYRRTELDGLIAAINDSGYGLTLGVHSRIQSWADEIYRRTQVGNTYVNRNMIGAVVGVQPFGGHNLSGTGPKAGGPHYLFQFAAEKVLTTNTVASGGNAALFNLDE